jgi:hypothetical protein
VLNKKCLFFDPDIHEGVGRQVSISTISGGMKATAVGRAQIMLGSGMIVEIDEALYVPESPRNLISMKALRSNGCQVFAMKRGDGLEVMRVRKGRENYDDFVDHGNGLYVGQIMAPTHGVMEIHYVNGLKSLETLMHERLGHPGISVTRKIRGSTRGAPPKWKGDGQFQIDRPCEACATGKFQMARYEYHIPSEAPEIMRNFQVDVHGPINPPCGPFRYFMDVICRHSRRSYVYLLATKDVVQAQVVKFVIKMRNQYPDRQIRSIRFDNAAEFVSATMKKFLDSLGIAHETCVPYAHSQNGSAEAHIKRLQQVARTLLMGCNLPASAWGYAIFHANALLNLRPVGEMNESPKELVEGEKPSVSHLRVFGCGVYVPIPPPKRTKLGPQRALAIYVGYETPSIIRYLDLMSGLSLRARFNDCVFDESIFPTVGLRKDAKDSEGKPMNMKPPAMGVKDDIFDVKPDPMGERPVNAEVRERLIREEIGLHMIATKAPDTFAPHQGIVRNEGICSQAGNTPTGIQIGGNPAREPPLRGGGSRMMGAKGAPPKKRKPPNSQTRTDPVKEARRENPNANGTIVPAPMTYEYGADAGGIEMEPTISLPPLPMRREVNNVRGRRNDLYCEDNDPMNVEEAQRQADWPKWQEAMQAELDALKRRDVLSNVMEMPENCRPVGHRWVFVKKRDANGIVVRHKARLVAKGFSQKPGEDFTETYAPVMDGTTYRYLLALAAKHKLVMETMDVVTAYLYGELDHEIYMSAPLGHEVSSAADMKRPVVLLKKALYGLKQSGRMWYQKLTAFLADRGFASHESAPCVFIKSKGKEFTIVAIYVDDLNIIGTPRAVAATKATMMEKFEMKDLGRLSHCLGLQVEHYECGVFVHQSAYVEKILLKYQMNTCNIMGTPMEVRGDREQYAERDEGEAALDEHLPYFTVVGELMWLANRTRPDIAFAVNVLARYTSNPCMRHWRGVQRIMKYLKGTSNHGILYRNGDTSATLIGYADAGYKSDKKTAKSQGGYVFNHGGAAISWKSRKQTVVATSTMHSELIALYEGVREASWLHRLMHFVETSTGLRDSSHPITIYEDNEACIAQVRKGFMKTDATKHIDPKYQAWISQENGNVVDVQPINSEHNTADVFTKALPKAVHWTHVRGLGMMSRAEAAALRP